MSSCGAQLQGGKRKSRQNKKGGAKSRKQEAGTRKNKQAGGKKGPSDWNKKVMEIYRELKKKDSSVKLGAAMKEASKRKKAGKL